MTYKNKKVIACIIARMKSVRLKEKALADLAGFTMMEQIIRRLKLSKHVTDIVICTSTAVEDKVLVEKSREWGVHAYAGHELDVLSRLIDVAKIYKADLVLRVTGDNPFTDAENIDRIVEHAINTGADYTRTGRLPLGVTAEAMTPEMMNRLHRLMPDPNQSEYMSFYSFNPDLFNCEILEPYPWQDRAFYSLTVDYPQDLELARKIYKVLAPTNGVPGLKEIIKFLDDDPEYREVPGDSEIKLPGGETMSYSALIEMLDQLAKKSKIKKQQYV